MVKAFRLAFGAPRIFLREGQKNLAPRPAPLRSFQAETLASRGGEDKGRARHGSGSDCKGNGVVLSSASNMTMSNDSWDGKFGMKPSVPPQTLRREILKWLHSLDLSQSIRQIRRYAEPGPFPPSWRDAPRDCSFAPVLTPASLFRPLLSFLQGRYERIFGCGDMQQVLPSKCSPSMPPGSLPRSRFVSWLSTC